MKQQKKDWDKVPWSPFFRAQFRAPADEHQAARLKYFHDRGIELYMNSIYQVELEELEMPPPFGRTIYLSIKTIDKQPRHDWRELQQIKNDLVGELVEAVELYPSEDRLVDTANQYHLFCFPELQFPKKQLPFGFQERLVAEGSTPGINETGKGSRQRGWRPELKPEDIVQGEELQKVRTGIGGRCPTDGSPLVFKGKFEMSGPDGTPIPFTRVECLKGKLVCFIAEKEAVVSSEKAGTQEPSP